MFALVVGDQELAPLLEGVQAVTGLPFPALCYRTPPSLDLKGAGFGTGLGLIADL